MIYKLLITYDIDKKDENNRYIIEKYLKSQIDWVHIQKSVWIIKSTSRIQIFNNLSENIPNSCISVTNISKRTPIYNKITVIEKCKNKDSLNMIEKYI